MAAALQPLEDGSQVYRLVGLGGVAMLAEGVAHGAVDILTGAVAVVKAYGADAIALYLVCHVAAEHRRTRAQGYRGLGVVALAGGIGDGGADIKGVEDPTVVVGIINREGQTQTEAALAVGDRGGQLLDMAVTATETPPPQSYPACRLGVHLGVLHRHTGIGHHPTGEQERVASLVTGAYRVPFYLERRPLVFLDPETGAERIGHVAVYVVSTGKTGGGQHKLAVGGAIAVGGHLVLGYHPAVGVVQTQGEVATCDGVALGGAAPVGSHHSHLYGLTGTIDAAVGKEAEPLFCLGL